MGRVGKALPVDKFTDPRSRDDLHGGIGMSGAVREATALRETTGLLQVGGTERPTD